MAKEVFYCDICNVVEMKCTKTIGTKQSGRNYRQRRFTCPVCGYSKLVYAGGVTDDMNIEKAITQMDKQYKQEQKAREL